MIIIPNDIEDLKRIEKSKFGCLDFGIVDNIIIEKTIELKEPEFKKDYDIIVLKNGKSRRKNRAELF